MTARMDLAEAVAWCGALPVPLGHSCPLTPAPASPMAALVARQRQQAEESARQLQAVPAPTRPDTAEEA